MLQSVILITKGDTFMAINQNNKDIKITLTKEQFEWLEQLSKESKKSKSRIIASVLENLKQESEVRGKYSSLHSFIRKGVIIEDPNTTHIGKDVEIEAGTVIRPNTIIEGKTHIGKNNVIGPNSYLENMEIGEGNTVIMSHLVDSYIGDNNQVGPFARMRGHASVDKNSRVGNFVELKGAHLHEGAKSAHLTYLGDCEIGERTNIGCGTITANYDGYNKSRTTIGKDVFIGSGSILIAPITVEDEAFVAAGAVLTKDVHKDELAIARAKQENKAGYSHIIKNRARAKKEASKNANH